MLNVSEAVKQAYINGNAKTETFLTVTTTDGVVHEYTPGNILSGSVSIVESLCSAETFDLSRVEKNELTFTLFNISEGISGLQGGNVVAKQRVYTDASDETVYTDIPLGTYTIAEPMNDGDYLYKCTAYDATMAKLDNLIDEWWKNLTFPITLRNLAISLFEYLGCPYDIPATFTNSDYSIESMNADFEGATGAEILGYIQEIVGGFFKADRQGVIRLKAPVSVGGGLLPQIGLYPSDDLRPSRGKNAFGEEGSAGIGDWDYPQIVGDLQLGDYDVKSVTKVQIRGTEDDIGIIAGSGTNTYVIQGNPLLFNLTAEDGETIAQNILDQVSKVEYKPFSGKFMAQPYVEVGDVASIETYKGNTGKAPIFQRTLSGARLAFDNFKCLGLEYREQVSSVNRKLTTINQRTHEIKNTVDEMSSTVANVEQRVTTNETNITQNAKEISLTAQRSGVFNLLVNSDFSNQADRTQGWNSDSSLVTPEYIYDEHFVGTINDYNKIENGYCLKLTVEKIDSSTIARFYQEINYDDIWAGVLQLQMTYKMATWDGSSRVACFVQLYDEDGQQLNYTVLGYTTVSDLAVHNYRSVFDVASMQGKKVGKARFGVYLDNISGTNVLEVNHILATFTETATRLPFYAWTNYASKDLISQINISPEGVKIRGSKVDIYGLTTFHNSDGTGGTTIDGATITAGTIIGATINSTKRMVWNYSGTDDYGDYSGTITAEAGSVSTNLTANGVSYKHGLVHRGTYSSMGTDVLTDGSIDAIGFDSYNFVGTGRNVYITGQYGESQNAAGIAVEQADNSNIRLIMVARYGSTSKRMTITKDAVGFTFGGSCWIDCNGIARINAEYRPAGGGHGEGQVAFPCAIGESNWSNW